MRVLYIAEWKRSRLIGYNIIIYVTIEEMAARAEEKVLLRKVSSDVERFAGEMQQLRATVNS